MEAELEMLRLELDEAKVHVRLLTERIDLLEIDRRDDKVSVDMLKEELLESIDRARGYDDRPQRP